MECCRYFAKLMNALFSAGLELFNSGRYFDAHETWEDLWRETQGPEKLLVQALVQSAVALHHASTGNYVGARSVMERSIRNMAGYRRHFGGVDVVEFRTQLQRVLREMDSERPFTAWRLPRLRRSARADEP